MRARPVAATLEVCVGSRNQQPSRMATVSIRFAQVTLEPPHRQTHFEVIHRVLKSGCRIEQRQLETADRLDRALAVDQVVAWRILGLCKTAREQPDASISQWLSPAEWEALWCKIHRRVDPPKTPPTVGQAVRWIAQPRGRGLG